MRDYHNVNEALFSYSHSDSSSNSFSHLYLFFIIYGVIDGHFEPDWEERAVNSYFDFRFEFCASNNPVYKFLSTNISYDSASPHYTNSEARGHSIKISILDSNSSLPKNPTVKVLTPNHENLNFCCLNLGFIALCAPSSLQKRLGPQKRVFAVFSENYSFFFGKTLLNKLRYRSQFWTNFYGIHTVSAGRQTYGWTLLFLETIGPIEPQIRRKMCLQNQFFGCKWDGMGFFEKKILKLYLVPHFLPPPNWKKNYIHFCHPTTPRSLKNGRPSQKWLFAVILENIVFFFEKVGRWKIFKTLTPTKKVIWIFVARPSPPTLKTVMSCHKWVFWCFLQKYCFFRKTCFMR